MLTQAAGRKNASQKDANTKKSAQSSTNETVSTPSKNDQGQQDSDATSTPASSSQKPREAKWPINVLLKLNAVREHYNNDWEKVGCEMNRQPGDCFRQKCLHEKNLYPWSREDDIRLLEMMDQGETNDKTIGNILYPSKSYGEDRVSRRRKLLKDNKLNTLALYQGTSVNDDSISIGLAQITEGTRDLHISDTDHVIPLEKALERLQTINKKWCEKCVHTMVERDYGIYYKYYKDDDELKKAIVNGKIEPTIETILPKVIDAYIRTNGICCYCGRDIEFTEHACTMEQAPTAASADHFFPKKMTFNSDTRLHFICRQCNYAKSNEEEDIFKKYLQDIKDFHNSSGTLSSKHEPLDDKNELEAWLTWKKFKKDRRKVTSSDAMDDDDRLFMEMVNAMGLRDPTTGAIGVFDSTMKKSNGFRITYWEWREDGKDNIWTQRKIVTGLEMEDFKRLNIEINMQFSRNARQLTKAERKRLENEAKKKVMKNTKKDEKNDFWKAYKELETEAYITLAKLFDNWLEAIKVAGRGSQLN